MVQEQGQRHRAGTPGRRARAGPGLVRGRSWLSPSEQGVCPPSRTLNSGNSVTHQDHVAKHVKGLWNARHLLPSDISMGLHTLGQLTCDVGSSVACMEHAPESLI